jgi:hypothetical protein
MFRVCSDISLLSGDIPARLTGGYPITIHLQAAIAFSTGLTSDLFSKHSDIANRRCKIMLADDGIYEGKYEADKADGRGKLTLPHGSVCEGVAIKEL